MKSWKRCSESEWEGVKETIQLTGGLWVCSNAAPGRRCQSPTPWVHHAAPQLLRRVWDAKRVSQPHHHEWVKRGEWVACLSGVGVAVGDGCGSHQHLEVFLLFDAWGCLSTWCTCIVQSFIHGTLTVMLNAQSTKVISGRNNSLCQCCHHSNFISEDNTMKKRQWWACKAMFWPVSGLKNLSKLWIFRKGKLNSFV